MGSLLLQVALEAGGQEAAACSARGEEAGAAALRANANAALATAAAVVVIVQVAVVVSNNKTKREHRVSGKSQWQHSWQHSWVLTRQCRVCFSIRWCTFVVLVLFSTFSCAMPVEHPSMLPPCFPLSTIEGQVLSKHEQRRIKLVPTTNE